MYTVSFSDCPRADIRYHITSTSRRARQYRYTFSSTPSQKIKIRQTGMGIKIDRINCKAITRQKYCGYRNCSGMLMYCTVLLCSNVWCRRIIRRAGAGRAEPDSQVKEYWLFERSMGYSVGVRWSRFLPSFSSLFFFKQQWFDNCKYPQLSTKTQVKTRLRINQIKEKSIRNRSELFPNFLSRRQNDYIAHTACGKAGCSWPAQWHGCKVGRDSDRDRRDAWGEVGNLVATG